MTVVAQINLATASHPSPEQEAPSEAVGKWARSLRLELPFCHPEERNYPFLSCWVSKGIYRQ